MNPIENLWELVDRKIRKYPQKSANSDELWEAIKREWYNIDKDVVRNLYFSMTRRINDLYVSKGGYTKY
jgi:hypothetical protein